jgi:hypothetical protein
MTDFELVPQPDLIPGFLELCPEFAERWREHSAYWVPERAGVYNDLAELAGFVVDSYEQGNHDVIARVLAHAERLLEANDSQTNGLIVVGLLEDIQTIASHRPFGYAVFAPHLGPISRRAWSEIERAWEGKSSLMEVIRSERRGR